MERAQQRDSTHWHERQDGLEIQGSPIVLGDQDFRYMFADVMDVLLRQARSGYAVAGIVMLLIMCIVLTEYYCMHMLYRGMSQTPSTWTSRSWTCYDTSLHSALRMHK